MFLPTPTLRAALPPVKTADEINALKTALGSIILSAPPAVQRALTELFMSVKLGFQGHGVMARLPDAHDIVTDWTILLDLLVQARRAADHAQGHAPACTGIEERFELLHRAHEHSLLMIEIMYELINAGEEFQTARDILEQSAELLMRELAADLFVCRLRLADGTWENVAADTEHTRATPIFVHYMEENLPYHPVMHAVQDELCKTYFVLSNDLRGTERGGESFDCTPYQEGYRSRLCFILRDQSCKAFGLIMLYDRRERYFERFEEAFLADCAKLVSLTVGRRLDVGQDALAKAAGGMAHVGNNALAVIKNHVEIVVEELEALAAEYGQCGPPPADKMEPEVLKLLEILDPCRKIEYLRRALQDVERLRGAIQKLLDSVQSPVLMPYIRGADVLDLEPDKALVPVSQE